MMLTPDAFDRALDDATHSVIAAFTKAGADWRDDAVTAIMDRVNDAIASELRPLLGLGGCPGRREIGCDCSEDCCLRAPSPVE